jgi:predicted polyphosphate/ATP-dependent NAD kinase
MKKTIGVVVNPIAGMGGKVGLKGTDGAETLRRAIEAGATPEAHMRAATALACFEPVADEVRFVTYPGAMGADSFADLPLEVHVVGELHSATTDAHDTERAVREICAAGVDLLLFVGGDGTARDVCCSIPDDVPVLGVPAGVKMHSAAFATSPNAAAELARHYLLAEERVTTCEAEIMDIDEEDWRCGRVSARLYGYVSCPFERRLIQGVKASSPGTEEMEIAEIAGRVIADMDEESIYVLGPGTTVRAVANVLGVPKTLIGVDVVRGRRLVAADVSERDLLELTRGKQAWIVVTIIGGQGYLFGRGNQQISARVIEQVGVDHIIVVATQRKIVALRGRPLLVDTGDAAVDESLAGYVSVRTGPQTTTLYRVEC